MRLLIVLCVPRLLFFLFAPRVMGRLGNHSVSAARRRLKCKWSNWNHKMICSEAFSSSPSEYSPASSVKASDSQVHTSRKRIAGNGTPQKGNLVSSAATPNKVPDTPKCGAFESYAKR